MDLNVKMEIPVLKGTLAREEDVRLASQLSATPLSSVKRPSVIPQVDGVRQDRDPRDRVPMATLAPSQIRAGMEFVLDPIQSVARR